MSLTCISCKLLFSVPALHQEHYKTDWHRYNLKRRLADLPSLTKEEFDQRAAAFNEISKTKGDKTSVSCEPCNKHFSSNNALTNHLKSKKHQEVIVSEASKPKKAKITPQPVAGKSNEEPMEEEDEEEFEDDGDWESCGEEEDEGMKKIVIDTNDCLFCDHQSDSTEGNVTHMTAEHSFFIPDVEYLVNLDGLIATLAAKIHIDRICLWCHGKGRGFRSIKSVKQHMIDKGHCKMLHEGDIVCDYTDFYDYSTIDTTKEAADVEAIDELLEDADYDFVLPSGATIGHRSLARYYKQNLQPVDSDAKQKVKKVLQYYKGLGYTGCTGQAAVKKAKDLQYLQRIKSKYNLKVGMRQNRNQPHFRLQVMF